MPRRLARLSAVATGVLAALVLAAAPAPAAAPTCPADPYEVDDPSTGVGPPVVTASVAVGSTARRVICQGREALPGKTEPRDVDWFEFTAVEGQAYTVEAVEVGPGLRNDADRGGLVVGFQQIGADGMPSAIVQNTAPNGDRSTTTALRAGRYLISAATGDSQLYPDNVQGTKTIQGTDGAYGVRLTATAPAPVLKSLTISPSTVNGGKSATATLTFSAPLLSGGSFIPIRSSSGLVAAPGGTRVAPGGITSMTVPINTRAVGQDTPVTISAQVDGVGPTLSAVVTVRR